jgi:polysaccharide biosynthesis transport protein
VLGSIDLKFYGSIFLRRLPYFVVIVAFLSALGIALASILPPVYRSTAEILVESQQIPGDLARSTVPTSPIEQIQIIEQRLMTRANLLTLAERFGIYAGQPAMTANAIVADMRARTQLGARMPDRGGATIISVSFSSPSPGQAAEVTNELVTLILRENVALRTGRAGDTLDFFEGEVERLGGEMDQLSQRIMAFKRENEGALPDGLAFRRSQQSLLQERMLQLEREASSLQDSRTRTVRIFERTGQLAGQFGGMTETARSPEETELDALQRQLSRARAIYSAANPNIRLLETRIAALQETVAEQRALVGDDDLDGMSPLDLQLAEIDGRLAYLAEEKTRMEAEIAELEASIQATPANAQILDGLERDYANLQGQYSAAVDRLATASVGERIEVMSKGERFSLIEPAVAPAEPDRPNRLMIAGAGVAGGLGAGFGFILLLELLNRSVRRPVELSNKLGIQPFATIPYIRTRRETRWKRAAILGALALIVVGIPAALFAVHTYYLPLDLLLRQGLAAIGLGGRPGSII